MDSKHTDRIRRRYNRMAPLLDLMGMLEERGRMARWRRALWSEAGGDVLEVGVGTGRNLSLYPPHCRVTAIDFSPRMIERARRRAAELGLNVDLRLMDVQDLSFPDATYDTVISTCVFCSVPDPVLGLRELRRVIRPHGRLLMLEHVRSAHWLLGPLMDWLNPFTAGLVGVNINRNTVGNLARAGWRPVRVQPLFRDILLAIVSEPASG